MVERALAAASGPRRLDAPAAGHAASGPLRPGRLRPLLRGHRALLRHGALPRLPDDPGAPLDRAERVGLGFDQRDPYPFILLNLAFSTQAAYAAPLILLAQNRQAERDRVAADEDRLVNRARAGRGGVPRPRARGLAPLAGQDRGDAAPGREERLEEREEREEREDRDRRGGLTRLRSRPARRRRARSSHAASSGVKYETPRLLVLLRRVQHRVVGQAGLVARSPASTASHSALSRPCVIEKRLYGQSG